MVENTVVHIVADKTEVMSKLVSPIGAKVQAYTNPRAFIENYDVESASVLILDFNASKEGGFALQDELKEKQIHLPIIFISDSASVAIAVEAMKRGAVEFLMKPVDEHALLQAVRRGLRLDQSRIKKNQVVKDVNSRLARLTKREREILELVIAAKSSKAIAAELGISYKTVELHRSRIIEKMEVNSAIELVKVMSGLFMAKELLPE